MDKKRPAENVLEELPLKVARVERTRTLAQEYYDEPKQAMALVMAWAYACDYSFGNTASDKMVMLTSLPLDILKVLVKLINPRGGLRRVHLPMQLGRSLFHVDHSLAVIPESVGCAYFAAIPPMRAGSVDLYGFQGHLLQRVCLWAHVTNITCEKENYLRIDCGQQQVWVRQQTGAFSSVSWTTFKDQIDHLVPHRCDSCSKIIEYGSEMTHIGPDRCYFGRGVGFCDVLRGSGCPFGVPDNDRRIFLRFYRFETKVFGLVEGARGSDYLPLFHLVELATGRTTSLHSHPITHFSNQDGTPCFVLPGRVLVWSESGLERVNCFELSPGSSVVWVGQVPYVVRVSEYEPRTEIFSIV